MKLKINEELKTLIPPLKEDEYNLLEQSLINEGCRDSLITWDDTIVDGHNRYEICTKNGIPFETEDRDFENIEAVKDWMDANQLGRRNLTNDQRKIIIGRRYNREKSQGKRTDITSDQNDHKLTSERLAEENNISAPTVRRYAKDSEFFNKLQEKEPETAQKVWSGETSLTDVKRQKKKEEKRERFKQKKNEFAKEVDTSVADSFCYNGSCLDYLQNDSIDNIDLLLTDPPYAMDYKSGWNDWDKIDGDVRNETVNLLDACFSLCQQKMNDDAHVYVFGNPNEIEYVKPIFERYFNLKNILVWDRQVIGMGDLKSYGRSYDIIYFGYNKAWKDLNGTRERDVLNYKRVSPNELIHPTEKPDDILKYLIKKSSNECDIVFDPFAGSCSTIRNAFELNRNAYGCELESKYIPEWMSKKI